MPQGIHTIWVSPIQIYKESTCPTPPPHAWNCSTEKSLHNKIIIIIIINNKK